MEETSKTKPQQKQKNVGVSYLLSLAQKENKQKIYFSMVMSIISGLASFVPFIAVYQCVMAVFHGERDTSRILTWGLIALISLVIRFVFQGFALSLSHIGAYDALYSVRTKISKHIGNINLGFFTENSVGEIKRVLMEDVERLEIFLAHQLPDVVTAVVVPVVVFVYLLTVNVPMALILIVPIVLTFLLMSAEMAVAKDVIAQIPTIVGRLNSGIMQFISGMTVMKTYHLTADSYKNFSDAVISYDDIWEKTAKKIAPISGVLKCVIESGVLFTLPLGGYLYCKGTLAIEEFIFFMIMSIVFLSSFNNLLNFSQIFSQISSGIERVKEVMEIEEMSDHGKKISADHGIEIRFEHVDFAYNDQQQDVLKDINLTLKRGTLTAFVGESGAGKSTAAMLIPRFWDITKGHIYMEGQDIKEISMDQLMDHMSFVFQEAFVLNDTVYHNIAIGKENATEEDVYNAAKAAQIHDFIMSLPDGYQTKMGDAGTKFSGGERQRLCIARAILKDAPVLVFDEATSFTDGENEHKIQMALDRLLVGKTTVMIAHRLHTIIHADQICVFKEGRIVEIGTHEELLNMHGEYEKLWTRYSEDTDYD